MLGVLSKSHGAANGPFPVAETLTPYDIMLNDIPGTPFSPDDYYNAQYLETSPLADDQTDPILLAGEFEGDIYIVDETLKEKLMSPPNLMVQRNAIIDPTLMWPNGIVPYVISSVYKAEERLVIAKAFRKIESVSCIKFVPRSREGDYIHMIKGDGCSSSVGKIGGAQPVVIGYGCNFAGIVMHEVLHALGFWHEQSRHDREKYITIVWQNIQSGMEYNFKKYNWTTMQNLGQEYDLASVMHYGPNAFAKDRGRPTIIANKNVEIGQRKYLSQVDIEKLNILYNCDQINIVSSGNRTSPHAPSKPNNNECVDTHEFCMNFAEQGECQQNPQWMKINCMKSCNECDLASKCQDLGPDCVSWSDRGECTNSAIFMQIYCQKACKLCGGDVQPNTSGCSDTHQHCHAWALGGQCRANPDWMLVNCNKSCKQC